MDTKYLVSTFVYDDNWHKTHKNEDTSFIIIGFEIFDVSKLGWDWNVVMP